MANQTSEDEVYELAKKRVKAKRDFWGNFIAWAAVNVVLIVVWALSGQGYLWFLWPLCIWGVFVVIHFFQVFVIQPKSDKEAIEKEADKIRRERGSV